MEVDAFLIAGQSNAGGNGDPFDLQMDCSPIEGCKQWDTATQTVIDIANPLKHHTIPAKVRVGFGYHFAKNYWLRTRRHVLLIPRAHGGTRLCIEWYPYAPFGKSLQSAIEQANVALEATGATLKGILWHQGESDTRFSPTQDLYLQQMLTLLREMRTQITGAEDIPFICGEMVREWVAVTPAAVPIQRAISEFPRMSYNTACVSSEGLRGNPWPNDKIHFSAPAQRELANRYLEAYFSLVNQ